MAKLNKLKRSFTDLIGSKDELDKEMDEKKISEEKRRSISDMIGSLGGGYGAQDGTGLGMDWGEEKKKDVKEKAGEFKDFFKNAYFAPE